MGRLGCAVDGLPGTLRHGEVTSVGVTAPSPGLTQPSPAVAPAAPPAPSAAAAAPTATTAPAIVTGRTTAATSSAHTWMASAALPQGENALDVTIVLPCYNEQDHVM